MLFARREREARPRARENFRQFISKIVFDCANEGKGEGLCLCEGRKVKPLISARRDFRMAARPIWYSDCRTVVFRGRFNRLKYARVRSICIGSRAWVGRCRRRN